MLPRGTRELYRMGWIDPLHSFDLNNVCAYCTATRAFIESTNFECGDLIAMKLKAEMKEQKKEAPTMKPFYTDPEGGVWPSKESYEKYLRLSKPSTFSPGGVTVGGETRMTASELTHAAASLREYQPLPKDYVAPFTPSPLTAKGSIPNPIYTPLYDARRKQLLSLGFRETSPYFKQAMKAESEQPIVDTDYDE